MERVLVIGDIHGSSYWEKLFNYKNSFDKVVFIGDYVDSFEHGVKKQLKNLEKILKFKVDNSDNVILLIGNHDIQYMTPFNKKLICINPLEHSLSYKFFYKIFQENIDSFTIAY